MQLGPDQVLLAVDIKFRGGLSVDELESAIDRLEQKIRDAEPTIQRIFIEAESLRSRPRSQSKPSMPDRRKRVLSRYPGSRPDLSRGARRATAPILPEIFLLPGPPYSPFRQP
jgi:hypothetical protein